MKTVILTSALLCALSGLVASAATRTVNNLNNSGPGSLREAISFSLNGDLIEFDVEGTIFLSSDLAIARSVTIVGPGADRLTIARENNDQTVTRILTVDAGTLNLSGVTIANGNLGFTGKGGVAGGAIHGGGILVNKKGILNLSACEVTNCQAIGILGEELFVRNADVLPDIDLKAGTGGEGRGGGIANFGKMTLRNCTISNCQAVGGEGGEIYEETKGGVADPSKPVITCTSGDGGAGFGGAIYNRGEAILERCTLVGNRAVGGAWAYIDGFRLFDHTGGNASEMRLGVSGSGFGGGIYTGNTNLQVYLTLRNCTIIGNASHGSRRWGDEIWSDDTGIDDGGGVYVAFNLFTTGNPPSVGSTIIAGNTASPNQAQDWRNVLISEGYNLVGKLDGSGGFGGYDLAGLGVSPIDPGVTPLGYFGGSVRVMGLRPGSPAIDKGKSFSGNVDARGRPRRFDFANIPNQIDGDGADIGAFERHVPLHIDGNLDGNADILLEKTRTTRLLFMRRGAIAGILDGPTLPAGNTLACAGRLSTDDALCYVVHDSAAGKVTVWRTDNGKKTSVSPSERLPVGYAPAAVADFNGDGIEDFLLWNKSTRKTGVRFWNGEQFSGPEKNGPTLPAGFVPVGCGDFNGDGKPDIAIYNAQQNKLSVLLMNGSALLSTQLLPKPESGFAPATVEDYNSDGNADVLLVRTATRETRFFFMSGTTLQRKADGPKIPFGYALK
jgi:FG-GAP-like repeat